MPLPKKVMGPLYASVAIAALMVSTTLLAIPIFTMGLFKLYPNLQWQIFCTKIVDKLVIAWTSFNKLYLDLFHPVRWDITGIENLDPNTWHLVVANHQSWLDIVVLQTIFTHKIPVLKFFIKDSLKWVPLLGFAWWAMGCPFMKRYSKAYIEKHPEKKGKDLQSTQKALESFQKTPASIMSFVEGTRFTQKKKAQQHSPYQHLLKPKSGGVSFVIGAMDKQITELLDVTIVYPHAQHSLWDFLCHRVDSIKVQVRHLPIPKPFLQPSLLEDEKLQAEFRLWLNQQWLEKDQLMAGL